TSPVSPTIWAWTLCPGSIVATLETTGRRPIEGGSLMILISANTAAAAPASSVPRKNAIGTSIVHRHRIAPGNIAKDLPKARIAGKREFRPSDGPLLKPEAARVAN